MGTGEVSDKQSRVYTSVQQTEISDHRLRRERNRTCFIFLYYNFCCEPPLILG